MGGDDELDAGDFSKWLAGMGAALRSERDADVPCGDCTACCTSSQFVHIGPEETDALSHIPAELLFAAPLLPAGHVVLGYDEHGRCPMLSAERCSIYEHRPKTCRTYDCRVFTAAGVNVDDDAKALIDRRVRRWRFRFPTEADRAEHGAVRAAATFLSEHASDLPDGAGAANPTQLAVLATEVFDTFLRRDETTDQMTVIDPDPAAVHVEVTRRRPPPVPKAAPVRRRRRFPRS
jgi:uncharacterized protein